MRAQEHPLEAQRLAAVTETGLMGGLPDAQQEAAVRLASDICGTPIAAVSLVGADRQWFSAIHGLDCRETPRDVAFCAHTILGDEPMVVGDAALDPRFSDNALVTGAPNIRFYAGFPLKTLNDPPVGSLCVIDTRPRRITDAQIQSLRTLAGLVSSQLEMHRYNHRLLAQSEQHRSLLDRMNRIASQVPGVIYQFRSGPDGSVSFPYASDRIREIYRVLPEDVRHDASAVFAVLHPDDRAGVEESIEESHRTLGPWKHEYRVRFEDGTEQWLFGSAVPQREPDGSTLWHGFIENISDRKRAEGRLTESRRIIGKQNIDLSIMADRAQRVVDDVSHEFRTPLAVIKEFASIISDGIAGPVSEDQARYLRMMSGAVADLNHMVEDLLDTSKLRAGMMRTDRRAHRIEEIVEIGRATLRRKALNRSVTIEERIDAGLPAVFADEEKVRRVISNLVTNAIKFSPEGGTVVLSATAGPGRGEATISVRDEGPGLSAAEIERLFGRTHRVPAGRGAKGMGLGLGLSIARELSCLNFGRISAVSEPGRGATFSFTVPIDDRHAVLEHFFASITDAEYLDPRIAMLRVSIPRGRDPEEPGNFLASATHPTDLVLPARTDDPSDTGRAWWLLGCTSSVDRWVDRLRETRRSQMAGAPGRLGDLTVRVLGNWAIPDQLGAASERIGRMLSDGHCRHADPLNGPGRCGGCSAGPEAA